MTSDVTLLEHERAWRSHASVEGRGARRWENRTAAAVTARVRRVIKTMAMCERMRHGRRGVTRSAGARCRTQAVKKFRARAARRRVAQAAEASARWRRSAAARVRRAEAERIRKRQEHGLAVNAAPVAANRGGGGSCKSRPPAMKYARTRQRPHAQGRRSGDEVMATARAPIKSAL
eukprot:4558-Pleurochrysis_carterae.AAC.1